MTETKFQLGEVYMTMPIIRAMQSNYAFYNFVRTSLNRYKQCDWGDIHDEDKEQNENAIKCGDKIVAVYGEEKNKIRIITESDRSCTTVMFLDEYTK